MRQILITLALLLTTQVFFAQDVARVRINDKFGFINKAGDFTIKPTFDKVGDFADGKAAAYNGEQWGFIDASGQLIIDYQFDKAKRFDSGIAVVAKDDRWFYIDDKGNEVKDMPFTQKVFDFKDGIAFYKDKLGKIGLINTEGAIVLEAKYTRIKPFVNGYASFSNGVAWGLIDKKGNEVIEAKYKHVGEYNEKGTLAVTLDGTQGLIGNGEFFEVRGATKIWEFKAGQSLTYARGDKLSGFINRAGQWVIAPKYKKARAFSNGLAPVSTDGKLWGFINEEGEMVIKEQYRDAEVFSADGLAPVKLNKLWGFINTKGELVIDDLYIITAGLATFTGQQKGFIDGLARVRKGKQWGFINTKGEVLNNTWYQNAELFVNQQ